VATLVPVDRPATLTELAYERLKAAILSGEFAAGQTQSVVALAEVLHMSRSPVRAAVERLASEGLVVQQAGGARVCTFEKQDMLNAFVVRRELEGLAAELATPRLTTLDLDELSATLEEFAHAVDRDDTTVARAKDLDFHRQIQTRCGNPVLIEHLERVQARVIVGTYSTAWAPSQHQAVAEHREILSRLRAGDPQGARASAIEHLRRAGERVAREWNGSDEPDPATP
jgi:DNA-binding GntR family transcriptional regulator